MNIPPTHLNPTKLFSAGTPQGKGTENDGNNASCCFDKGVR